MSPNKQYKFRIFDKAGNYLGDLANCNFKQFRMILNGGLGDLEFDVPVKFDWAYTSQLTVPFNRLEVWCIDGDTDRNGMRIYSGYLNDINPHIEGAKEGLTITARGHAARFAFLPLIQDIGGTYYTTLNPSSTTGLTTSAGSAASVERIFLALIDTYNAFAHYPVLNYTATSLAPTGATVTGSFQYVSNTFAQAFQSTIDFAPAGTFWFADADYVMNLVNLGTTPDHILSFGRQIYSWNDHLQLDGMLNEMIISLSDFSANYNFYDAGSSVADYGDWWSIEASDYADFTDTETYATSQIHAGKVPQRRLEIVVPDNHSALPNFKNYGYDIELFRPGQMVQINNLPVAVQAGISTLFQIQAVTYTPDAATLELSRLADSLARDYAQKQSDLDAFYVAQNPSTLAGGAGV